MPVERLTLSLKSFAEELGFDPARFVGVEVKRKQQIIQVLLEGQDDDTRRADDRHDAPAGG